MEADSALEQADVFRLFPTLTLPPARLSFFSIETGELPIFMRTALLLLAAAATLTSTTFSQVSERPQPAPSTPVAPPPGPPVTPGQIRPVHPGGPPIAPANPAFPNRLSGAATNIAPRPTQPAQRLRVFTNATPNRSSGFFTNVPATRFPGTLTNGVAIPGGTGGTGSGAGTPPVGGTGATGVGATGNAGNLIQGTGATGVGAGGLTSSAGTQTQPFMTPAQQVQVNRLAREILVVRTGRMNLAQRQQLIAALRTSAAGPVRPSEPLLIRLANDMVATVPRLNLNGPQTSQLATEVHRILNSSQLTPEQAQIALANAQQLISSSRFGVQHGQALIHDLVAITNELQNEAAGAAVPATTDPGLPQPPPFRPFP